MWLCLMILGWGSVGLMIKSYYLGFEKKILEKFYEWTFRACLLRLVFFGDQFIISGEYDFEIIIWKVITSERFKKLQATGQYFRCL